MPIYYALFLDWTYVPVSLVVVPVVSVALAAATVFGLHLFVGAARGRDRRDNGRDKQAVRRPWWGEAGNSGSID